VHGDLEDEHLYEVERMALAPTAASALPRHRLQVDGNTSMSHGASQPGLGGAHAPGQSRDRAVRYAVRRKHFRGGNRTMYVSESAATDRSG